ncbi:MAG: MarC family protein [Bacteroidaceae bacterium]|nr:MarC family protein [Bacteroidaceae bacterium]
MEWFSDFNLMHFLSAFMVLFAIIDPVGTMPIIIGIRDSGKKIDSGKAVFYSFSLMIVFFYLGDVLLGLFGVDINSFAVAGALILFLMALEMVLGVEIFKDMGLHSVDATYLPVVFPLLAGPGSFTTLLSLKAEYATLNIFLGLILNAAVVFTILKFTTKLHKFLGAGGLYFMKKFFGVVLLAISVKLFMSNISYLLSNIAHQ